MLTRSRLSTKRMKQPIVERYEVRQDPQVFSHWIYFLLFAIFIFWLFSHLSDWNSVYPAFIIFAIAFGLTRPSDQMKLVLHTKRHKLVIEQVFARLDAPEVRTELPWEELETFQYVTDTEGDSYLYLKWQNGTTNNFLKGDTVAFRDYLRAFFPEKEKKNYSIFSS